MANKDKLVSKQLRGMFESRRPKGKRWYGYLGKHDGTIDVGSKPGYYYARIPKGASGTMEVGEFRGSVASVVNMPVTIEEDVITGERYIVDIDAIGFAAGGGTGDPSGFGGIPHHHLTHQLGGDDILELRPIQIVDCRTEPSTTPMHVTVREGWYCVGSVMKQLAAQVDVDLTANWPAAGAKWVWITVDAAGAVTVVDDGDTDWATMNYPTSGNFVSSIVVMRFGHPHVAIGDIVDMRFLHNSSKIPNPTARGQILRANASLLFELYNKGTQYQVLTGGATDPTWGAVALDQATAISGHLLVANMSVFAKPRLLTLAGIWEEYDTVQAAITAAVAGENVYVPPKPDGGTWDERVLLKDGVGLIGVGPYGSVHIYWKDAAEWRGAIYTAVAACTATVTNIKITCWYDTISQLSYGVYMAHTSGTVTFKNCIIGAYPELASIASSRCVSAAGAGDTSLINCELVTYPGSARTTLVHNSGSGTVNVVGGWGHKSDFSAATGTVFTNAGAGQICAGGFIFDDGYTYNDPAYFEGTDLHQIPGYTADATPDPAADYIVTLDATDGLHKKVLPNNLFSQASLLDGSLTTPRIPYASDANTLVDAAEMTWNNTGKFINLNANIWGIGEIVLDLNFTGTDFDTAAECTAVGVKLSADSGGPVASLPTALVGVVGGDWTHTAGKGWLAANMNDNEGPGIYIPLMRPGNWEIETRWDSQDATAAYMCMFYIGYICNSNHVGAAAFIDDGSAAQIQYIANIITNDGDDTYTSRYAGVALDGAATRTIKFKSENGCIAVWDDQDDAWHLYQGRQTVGHSYTASGLFIQAVKNSGADMDTVYLARLILKYLL